MRAALTPPQPLEATDWVCMCTVYCTEESFGSEFTNTRSLPLHAAPPGIGAAGSAAEVSARLKSGLCGATCCCSDKKIDECKAEVGTLPGDLPAQHKLDARELYHLWDPSK